jgi:opacity protein-like surface antigen
MKTSMRIASALTFVAAVALPAVARAQSANFNLAGGFSLANGDFGQRNDAGYSIGVGLGMTQAGSPLSFRADGIYNEFDAKFNLGKSHAGGAIASVLYDFVMKDASFTPYAIGGVGLYSTKEADRVNGESETNVGWSLGAGIRIPLSGFSAYVESRYHSISSAPNGGIAFAPVVFGLRF